MKKESRFVNKICIGSKEFISFPFVSQKKVIARIDTGAKTSAIHCERVWIQRFKNKQVLCAELLNNSTGMMEFTHFKLKKIKSSNGQVQIRDVVNLVVQFGNDVFESEFTLTNRDNMNHAVLLGRKFLRKKYIVDVSRMYILGKK